MLTRVAATVAAGTTMACTAAGAAGAVPVTVAYAPTGAEQAFVVPGGVHVIHVVATGGKGGVGDQSDAAGGFGARVTADVPVTPGAVLYVEVGANGAGTTAATGGPTVFNGGGGGGSGGGGYGGAGGGGASDLRTVPMAQAGATLTSRLLVAAGGGGSGGAGSNAGGAAGQAGGGQPGGPTGGGAGSLGGGGAAGTGQSAGPFSPLPTAGAFGIGGTGGTVSGMSGGGGGGGGGYYGGGGGAGRGGGAGGGGGGGSSFAAADAANLAVEADPTGLPQVLVSYEPVATAELTPDGVVFGTQAPGTISAPQRVTLSNAGTLPLGVSGIALGGVASGDFSVDDACGSAVAPGGSCTLFVRFTPTAAGVRAATLTVTGNAAAGPASVALTGIGAAAGGEAAPGPGPAPVAPVLSALELDHATFRAATAAVRAKKAKHPTGATVSYTLSAPATTTFAIEQRRKGVRSGSRCVAAPKHRRKSARKCTRTVTLGTVMMADGAAGRRSHKLSARVRGRRLSPGSYVLRVTPKGATGLKGAASTVRFRVAKS